MLKETSVFRYSRLQNKVNYDYDAQEARITYNLVDENNLITAKKLCANTK